MSKPLKLKMEFETNNPCVRSFNRIICGWGMRKIPYDEKGNYKGQTAPLWANPSLTFFLSIFIVNLILSLLFVGCFIGVKYETNRNNCSDDKKYKNEFIIIGSVILLVNSLYWLFLYLKKYASDQEWSRYMIFLAILWTALIGFTIAEIIVTVKSLDDYDKAFRGLKMSTCQKVFLASICINFIVGICNAIVSIIVIVMVFIISKNLFFQKYVPHTASCEDEDIIIIE